MPTMMALYAVSVLLPASMLAGAVAGALIRRYVVLQGSSAAQESISEARGPASISGRPVLTVIQGWQAPVNRLAQSRWAQAGLEQARALQSKWIQPWTGGRNGCGRGEQQRAG